MANCSFAPLNQLFISGQNHLFPFKFVFWYFYSKSGDFKRALTKFAGYFCIVSFVVAGPFVAKSLYYAGTPLFPFGVGALAINQSIDKNSLEWRSLVRKTQEVLATKDQYGSGRSLLEFLRHFWLIAVPEK